MATAQSLGRSLFILLNSEEVREETQREGAGEGNRLQSDLEIHLIAKSSLNPTHKGLALC